MKSNKWLLKIVVVTAIIFSGCNLEESVYSKDNHLKTTKIREGLYSEVFFIRSILSETMVRYSEYITDSMNFRKYVYTYNKGEWIYGEMSKNDVLTIYKVSGTLVSDIYVVYDTTKIGTYNIVELKREGKFE